MRGYSVITLERPKNPINIGHVLRAAQAYDSALVVIGWRHAAMRMPTDTMKCWRHVPVIRTDSVWDHVPYGCIPVAIERIEGATPLPEFKHPERAFYIFGPEDGEVKVESRERAAHVVTIPAGCLNLAMAVNVVLYDRLAKSG